MRTLRLDGESDEEFAKRAEKTADYAKILVNACLANECVRQFISDPSLPMWTEASCIRSPTVRIDYEQATAIGGIGETLAVTRKKSWGQGPWLLPLESADPVDPKFIVYVYKPNSAYNRRFLQRQRLKELLGKRYRPRVERAKVSTKKLFLKQLARHEKLAIQRILNVGPTEFWRGCRGKAFLSLPPRLDQLYLDFMADD